MNKEYLLFGSCLIIFIMHQVLEKIDNVSVELADNYLDALVCMPIILQLIVWERRFLLSDPFNKLPIMHCAGYFMVIAIAAELLFPSISSRFTADYIDIFCYGAGTLLYIGINNSTYPRTDSIDN
jgi:hypothetical protein